MCSLRNSRIKPALHVFCLLLAVFTLTDAATEDEFLTCVSCNYSSLNECNASKMTCKAKKATGGCLTTSEDIALDGKPKGFISKACVNETDQDSLRLLTLTLGEGIYFRSNITLCTTDNCNKETYPVEGNSSLNGQQCPSCFSLTDKPCKSVMTNCTGLETFCMDASGTVYTPGDFPKMFAAQGCTTKSLKNTTLAIFEPSTFYIFDRMEVYEAPFVPTAATPTKEVTATTTKDGTSQISRGISTTLLLSGFLWVLLVKLPS